MRFKDRLWSKMRRRRTRRRRMRQWRRRRRWWRRRRKQSRPPTLEMAGGQDGQGEGVQCNLRSNHWEKREPSDKKHGCRDYEVLDAFCQVGEGWKVEEEVRWWREHSPRHQGRRPGSSSSPSPPSHYWTALAGKAALARGRLPGLFSACKENNQILSNDK